MEKESQNGVQTLKAHLAINVENVERSLGFYRKMLGIEPSKVRTGYAKFDVQNPPLNLTLNEWPGVGRGAISHLGIQVASTADVVKMRERWHQAGLVTRDEMQTNCCYAVQDKTWVADPDGNQWEVFVVLEDNLAETSVCCQPEAETKGEAETTAACSTEKVAGAQASSCCAPTASEPASLAR